MKKPMDLGTIRDKMDAKDTAGYKHVQDVGDDIRLVFTNAMTYNQEGSDVHVMAKTLLDKFDEKWKALLEPKLAEEVPLFEVPGQSGSINASLFLILFCNRGQDYGC